MQALFNGFVVVAFFEYVSVGYDCFKTESFLKLLGGISWMLGLITGKRSGVSTVPLLVFSLPILPSKSFSFISKLKAET